MKQKIALRIIIGLAISSLATYALAKQPRASMTVHAAQPGPVIDRHIFGQFAEHLGDGIYGGVWVGTDSAIPNVRGIRSDVVEALRALKVADVRWPGGCFADWYNWRNGVGPASTRPSTYNHNWGGAIDTNAFGTHEFMDFVEQIGSEAYVSVNVGSASPREASEWLEYMTTPKPTTLGKEREANGRKSPYKVKFLGLGNEAWGCAGAMSADSYVEKMKSFAMYAENLNPLQSGEMKFMPGPDPMQRIAVGPADGDTTYTEAVMKALPTGAFSQWNIDGISLHHYTMGPDGQMRDPSTGFGEREYAAFLHNTYEMDALIAKHSAIMDRYDAKKRVMLAVDEWGNWLKPLDGTPMFFLRQQGSLRDAITAALNLHIFARHADRVRVANIAQMVNVLQSMILTEKEQMVLTPSYYVFRMYVPFQDARFLPVAIDAGQYVYKDISLPQVDAIAARATDGQLWLALVNLDPNNPAEVAAAIDGVSARAASGEVLTADRVDAVNSFTKEDAVVAKPYRADASGGKLMLSLPSKSVTVIRIQE